MKAITYIFRIIALPFVAGIAIISCLRLWFILCKNFLLYGGNLVAFTKEHTPTTLADILEFLKGKLNDQNNN
jgi:hypothetical protein